MTDCKRFKIVNWKLALLALIGVALLTSLGFWQLSRAKQKQILIKSFAARTQAQPLNAESLNFTRDLRYYRATLSGNFDNQHSVLLDNKIVAGNVGYEVYTPFYSPGLKKPLLIDRGFVPLGASRKELPGIRSVTGKVTITGMFNVPPSYVALGGLLADADVKPTWPLRVEYIDTDQIYGKEKFYPYVLMLNAKDPAAYQIEWQAIVTMPPERHIAYAVQWFALALTLLILSLVLNRKAGSIRGQ